MTEEPKCVFHPECDEPVIDPQKHPVCHSHTVDLLVAIVQASGPKSSPNAVHDEPAREEL